MASPGAGPAREVPELTVGGAGRARPVAALASRTGMGMATGKIFAIGFNKSGSVSMHQLFRALGYRSYHGEKWLACADMDFFNAYDCFSDDIPRDLPRLDREFPGSRYILQVRDLRGWLLSRLAHIERAKLRGEYRGGRGWDCTEYAVKAWVRQRNEWHMYVLKYFEQRRRDLLVVNYVRDERAATKIAAFLSRKGAFPRRKVNANPSKGRSPQHIELVERCAAGLGLAAEELNFDLLCPSQLDARTSGAFPADSSLLES